MTNEIPFGRGAAQHGVIAIASEAFGRATGTPLLLITIIGVGMQMLLWHNDFCKELVTHG
jgi:hypothetical protein